MESPYNTIVQIALPTWKAPTIPWHRLHYQHGKTLQYRSTDCATNTERPCNTATQLAQSTQKGPAIPQRRLRNQHGKAPRFAIPMHILRNQHGKFLQYHSTDCAINTERPCGPQFQCLYCAINTESPCNTKVHIVQSAWKDPSIPRHILEGIRPHACNWGQDIGYRGYRSGSSALLFLLLLNMEICCGKWGKRQYGV